MQPLRRAVQQGGHGPPPVLDPLFHFRAEGILGAGISVPLRQDFYHGVRHGPGDGGGGGVIQVNHLVKNSFPGGLPKPGDSSIIGHAKPL